MCVCLCVCLCVYSEYLFQQEGRGSEGEGPAVMVVEELLWLSGTVHHLVVDAGDVQDQTNHKTKTCGQTHTHTHMSILVTLRYSAFKA